MRARGFPLLVMLLSTAVMVMSLLEIQKTFPDAENSLAEYAPQEPLFVPDIQATPDAEKPLPLPELPDNPVDFAALQQQNPEIVAWIKLPNTKINYPVMQSSSEHPEDYYLYRNESGEKSRYGSIYIQKYNHADFSDPNTILYGHNMANGSMFAAVHKFKKSSFFEENQYLYVYVPGHELVYRIYSIFSYEERNPSTGGVKHLLWAYDFDTEDGKQAFIDKTLDPKAPIQQVRDGVFPTPSDRLITLSTCVNNNEGDGRLLLVAVLESDTLTK